MLFEPSTKINKDPTLTLPEFCRMRGVNYETFRSRVRTSKDFPLPKYYAGQKRKPYYAVNALEKWHNEWLMTHQPRNRRTGNV